MPFTKVSIKKAFTYIEPGPVVLVTTNDGDRNNIMTISWHMVMDFTPRIAISIGPWNQPFKTLMKTKECVIAIPTVDQGMSCVSGMHLGRLCQSSWHRGLAG